jgi:hypothetical protein
MDAPFDAGILELLTTQRAQRLHDRVARLGIAVADVPDRVSWFAHQPIPIESASDGEARFIERLREFDQSDSWFVASYVSHW